MSYPFAAASVLMMSGVVAITVAQGHAFQHSTAPRHLTVLFLCPHGAAKSVLASAYFQKVAKERGLNVRVDAAGTDPDERISPVVADHLRQKGYEAPKKPRKVTQTDIDSADVVISIGCDLTGLKVPGNLRQWDEVPGPGQDFNAADEAIRRRVMALVEELLAERKK